MTNNIGHNRFYQTFTPFLTPKTPTAEKTMKGRDFTVRKPHPALPKEFYRTLTTGIILLIPMLAIGISRKSIKSMVKQSNLDYFRISYREPDCLRTKVYLQIERLKTAIGKKLLSWLPLVTRTKDKVTTRLNDVNNTDLGARTFRGINAFFNDIKKQAANREYEKVLRSYQEMEKLVTRELDVIEQSANGKLKILFDNNLLKNPLDELPKAVDISKTATGQNRADEIRRLMNIVKQMIKDEKVNYSSIAPKITYSCEDIFFDAENALKNITVRLQDVNGDKQAKDIIKNIYETLEKYRFAEIIPNSPSMTSKQVRKVHLDECFKLIEDLKTATKGQAAVEIKNFRQILKANTDETGMGAIERIRELLKCGDIHPEFLKDGMSPSILKHYRSADYIKTKQSINDFVRKLNFAERTQSKFLGKRMLETERGSVFPQMASLIVPGTILSINSGNNDQRKQDMKSIRFSFLAGAGTMFVSRYVTMWKKTSSVLCGLFVALLAAHVHYKFFDKDKKSS